MASVNKLILIGRLTRDPEVRSFPNGGKIVTFSFASNNRKKNSQTGEWEDEPMYIDCKVFNRGEYGKKADLAEQYLHKGDLTYLEGKLVLETWNDKNSGAKRSKHVFVVDDMQFLQPKRDGGGYTGQQGQEQDEERQSKRRGAKAPPPDDDETSTGGGNSGDDIPF